jgi:hypothetical protein
MQNNLKDMFKNSAQKTPRQAYKFGSNSKILFI